MATTETKEIQIPSEHCWQASAIRVGVKSFKISMGKEEGTITFEKRRHLDQDWLQIHFSKYERQYKSCSLGHFHEVDKKEYKYIATSIPWEFSEQVSSWLADGNWTDIQRSRNPEKYDVHKLLEENKKLRGIIKKIKGVEI